MGNLQLPNGYSLKEETVPYREVANKSRKVYILSRNGGPPLFFFWDTITQEDLDTAIAKIEGAIPEAR